jgi:hypothetical protein
MLLQDQGRPSSILYTNLLLCHPEKQILWGIVSDTYNLQKKYFSGRGKQMRNWLRHSRNNRSATVWARDLPGQTDSLTTAEGKVISDRF